MSDLNFYKNLLETTNLNESVNQIKRFNQLNENSFRFPQLNQVDCLKVSVVRKIEKLLERSISELKIMSSSEDRAAAGAEDYIQCICSSLNAIRILCRDKEQIEETFSNDNFLNHLIKLAGLTTTLTGNEEDVDVGDYLDEQQLQQQSQVIKVNLFLLLNSTTSSQEIVISSLKVIANLIYNCNYAQRYFSTKTNILDALAGTIKEFNPKAFSNNISINIFNLRILFLLTTFDSSLLLKLKDNFQIMTYLIEIVDQIMKERLTNNNSNNSTSSGIVKQIAATNHRKASQIEYCYLKSEDIEYLIELLKLLYNLTMDKKESTKISVEEYEAHLMRLVSVLRDLLTCKEEILNIIEENEQQQPVRKANIDELHSNIINLLLNVPLFCYEELLIPLGSGTNSSSRQAATSKLKNKRLFKKKMMSSKTSLDTGNHSPEFSVDDFEFEGKNVEAVVIILRYLKRCLNLFLRQNCDDMLNIKNPQNASDHLQPVLLLLTVITKSNSTIRRFCRYKVLPPLVDQDVFKLPTDGKRFRNQLVCLMTDVNTNVKHLSERFLYVLCKENIGRLIKYTGYGNSAGLIADIGFLQLKLSKDTKDVDNYSTDSESSDTEEYEKIKDYVNNVTGKYEKERRNPLEGMSEEQKEMIVHELMCSIDKMSRLGIIKPGGVDENGKVVEIDHVLQVPDFIENMKSLTDSAAAKKRDEENDFKS